MTEKYTLTVGDLRGLLETLKCGDHEPVFVAASDDQAEHNVVSMIDPDTDEDVEGVCIIAREAREL